MHELAIAESVLSTITARTGDRPVREVRLEVGRLSGISADSLRFCFELAAAGTCIDGAALDIAEPPGRGRCRTCAEEFLLRTGSCSVPAAVRMSGCSAGTSCASCRWRWLGRCARPAAAAPAPGPG